MASSYRRKQRRQARLSRVDYYTRDFSNLIELLRPIRTVRSIYGSPRLRRPDDRRPNRRPVVLMSPQHGRVFRDKRGAPKALLTEKSADKNQPVKQRETSLCKCVRERSPAQKKHAHNFFRNYGSRGTGSGIPCVC